MRVFILCLMTLCHSPALADGVSTGNLSTRSDCACITRGGSKVPLGQSACLSVGGRSFMARCDMSQNVLTWRKTGEGCPSATLFPVSGPTAVPRS